MDLFISVQPKFYNGAKVILFSKEFKKAIRVMPNGNVNCLGGHGMKGDFKHFFCKYDIKTILILQHSFLFMVGGLEL